MSKSRIIEIEKDGHTYRGTYELQGDILTVHANSQTKSTNLGGIPPESLAELLLSEIYA